MSKIEKDDKAFVIIELLIALLIIAIIGMIGWIVYKDHKTLASTVDSNRSNTTGSTSGSITGQNSSISYSSWKNYCEMVNASPPYDCIKYDPSWTLTETNDHFSSIFYIINSSNTAAVQYDNLFVYSISQIDEVDTGNPLSDSPNSNVQIALIDQNTNAYSYKFFTQSISSMANNNTAYKVIGGYYLGSQENIPNYVVLDTATIKSYGLQVGKISSLQGSLTIAGDDSYYVWGGPISSNPFSPSQAKDWLRSSDGLTVLETLESSSLHALPGK